MSSSSGKVGVYTFNRRFGVGSLEEIQVSPPATSSPDCGVARVLGVRCWVLGREFSQR